MPYFSLDTNIHIDDNDFADKASSFIAELIQKPEAYVMVKINDQQTMRFAASNTPLAHIQLKSLGLDDSKTCDYSREICQFIEHHLSITANRVYIEFSSPERHHWGWDSKTFG